MYVEEGTIELVSLTIYQWFTQITYSSLIL